MRFRFWPRDAIAWRFGVTIVASMAGAAGLIGLFFVFGGVWARPPVEEAARLEGLKVTAQMIAVSPPEMRLALAEAARTQIYRVDWHPAGSPVSAWLATAVPSRRSVEWSEKIRELTDALRLDTKAFVHGDASIFAPDFPLDAVPHARYFTVDLGDGSWLVFSNLQRNWGLSYSKRLGIWAILALASFVVVSAIATRQLSRPIRDFAIAVRRAGMLPRTAPIAEEGPKELREVIAAFNDMQAQIHEFVTYRTSMLAAISHDLRTPLTRIRLRGEFISDKTQQAKLFQDADEMRAMIDGALAFFRGDADEEGARAFDLADALQSIAEGYADQGIEIGYAGPDHLTYFGRPIALKRALTNLIENAVKYGTPPEVALLQDSGGVVVVVRDRGPGIPAEALDRVFKPFYRLDPSRNRATGGVGLGLTAAQAVIRGHGGEIAIRNREDGGLEATVRLPSAP